LNNEQDLFGHTNSAFRSAALSGDTPRRRRQPFAIGPFAAGARPGNTDHAAEVRLCVPIIDEARSASMPDEIARALPDRRMGADRLVVRRSIKSNKSRGKNEIL
jgi:hypothetical protein